MDRTRGSRSSPLGRGLLAVLPPVATAAAALALAVPAGGQAGQVTFSIDWHGPTISIPDSAFGTPIVDADVLTTALPLPGPGPLPPPATFQSGGFGPAPPLGIPTVPPCVGKPPGAMCPSELDALSYGRDRLLTPNEPPGVIWFSTDEYATGSPGLMAPPPPNLRTEGPVFPLRADEAAGDVWVDLGLPAGPIPPFPLGGPIVGHVGALDGDGLVSATGWTYPGLGILEPIPPTFTPLDFGDNLDALALDTLPVAAPFPVFYSLDPHWPDPLGYPNEGTAGANGFRPGDVLVSWAPGGPPMLFAPAQMLGLDLVGGPESDDLDALILNENGSGLFEPSLTPYDWLSGQTDMLMFSVRRGSAVIGSPDSIFGAPIEEGDILVPPTPAGASPLPGIFIPAEALGLATTRSGMPGGITGLGDDLNALAAPVVPLFDCNGTGLEDAIDIALGSSWDVNRNGVPDECEVVSSSYCFGVGCPCGNDDPNAGCINWTGSGALLSASGTSSVTNDDLVLTATPMRPNQPGLYYFGPNQISLPFGNGLRCVGGGPIGVRRMPVRNSGPSGTITEGPGIVAWSWTLPSAAFHIVAGQTWNFQCWFRDPGGPCGFSFNFSNAISITFTP